MFIISHCSKILLIAWYKNVQRLYFCPHWTVIEPKYLKHLTFVFFFFIFSYWVLQRSLQPFQVSDTKWSSIREWKRDKIIEYSFDVERRFLTANKYDPKWISFRIKQVKRQSTGYIRPGL